MGNKEHFTILPNLMVWKYAQYFFVSKYVLHIFNVNMNAK